MDRMMISHILHKMDCIPQFEAIRSPLKKTRMTWSSALLKSREERHLKEITRCELFTLTNWSRCLLICLRHPHRPVQPGGHFERSHRKPQ